MRGVHAGGAKAGVAKVDRAGAPVCDHHVVGFVIVVKLDLTHGKAGQFPRQPGDLGPHGRWGVNRGDLHPPGEVVRGIGPLHQIVKSGEPDRRSPDRRVAGGGIVADQIRGRLSPNLFADDQICLLDMGDQGGHGPGGQAFGQQFMRGGDASGALIERLRAEKAGHYRAARTVERQNGLCRFGAQQAHIVKGQSFGPSLFQPGEMSATRAGAADHPPVWLIWRPISPETV